MNRFIQRLGVLFLALCILLPFMPAQAQDEAPAVLIMPADRAQFLPGTMFDFRVEVHADAMPEDFAITVNGTPAAEMFGAEGVAETWEFGSEEAPTTAQSMIWRGLMAPAPGEYVVEVTAGGATHTATWTVRQPVAGEAKNVILFITDGTNVAALSAARLISRGQYNGYYNGALAMDGMAEVGLVHTSGLDSILTDSANSASTYNNGHKTTTNATGVYADTSPDRLDDPRTETFAEILRRTRGMSIGIVTTADWTDATPSSVFGHGRDRSNGNRAAYAAMPLDSGLLPEVIMGGGASFMLPSTAEGTKRTDERDLFAEYEAAGYTVVTSKTELDAAMSAETPGHLMGIFHSADMSVWLDRNVYTDNLGSFPDQPGLVDMTLSALEILNTNPNGFYLEVEAANVDKRLHFLDSDRAMADLIEFDEAVGATIAWAAENAPNTLIVVTSDHSTGGFDVYGVVDIAAFNAATDDAGRRNAIGHYDRAGYPDYVDADGDHFPDNWEISRPLAFAYTNFPDYTEDFVVSEVPRVPAVTGEDGSTQVDNPEDDPNGLTMTGNIVTNSAASVHTLQDIFIFADGPGAEHFGRVIENTEVFFGMAAALGLDPSAEGGMATAVNTHVPSKSGSERGTQTAGVSSTSGTNSTLVTVLLIGLAFVAGMAVNRRKTHKQ